MSEAAAAARFRAFFGRDPRDGELADVRRDRDIALVIGELDGVLYRTELEPEPYLHRFKKTDRPLLLVSSDGRQIHTIKGSYVFTKRGFVG
jgi:hypothetical protein